MGLYHRIVFLACLLFNFIKAVVSVLVLLDSILRVSIYANLVVLIVRIAVTVRQIVQCVHKMLFFITMSVLMNVVLDTILMLIQLHAKIVISHVLIVQDQLSLSVHRVLLLKYYIKVNACLHVQLELH